jgi:type II secretion system protein G
MRYAWQAKGCRGSRAPRQQLSKKEREMEASLKRLRQRREELGDEGGFTLIELLIVIVILGVLAAIVVFAVQNLTGQSATAACQAEYKTVETALESYKAQVGNYPAAFTNLQSTNVPAVGGGTAGPWLRDTVPTGSADNPNYWFSFNTTSGAITVTAKSGTTSTGDNTACAGA